MIFFSNDQINFYPLFNYSKFLPNFTVPRSPSFFLILSSITPLFQFFRRSHVFTSAFPIRPIRFGLFSVAAKIPCIQRMRIKKSIFSNISSGYKFFQKLLSSSIVGILKKNSFYLQDLLITALRYFQYSNSSC